MNERPVVAFASRPVYWSPAPATKQKRPCERHPREEMMQQYDYIVIFLFCCCPVCELFSGSQWWQMEKHNYEISLFWTKTEEIGNPATFDLQVWRSKLQPEIPKRVVGECDFVWSQSIAAWGDVAQMVNQSGSPSLWGQTIQDFVETHISWYCLAYCTTQSSRGRTLYIHPVSMKP